MAITGGIKFFEKSMALGTDGASAVASSGTVTALRALDRNPFTIWKTQGSSDAVNETLTITFAEEKTIDRLFLLQHNFKSYSVKYDVAGVPTDFANVLGLNGEIKSGITETTYSRNSSYYEFDPVTTAEIVIECDETQIPDEEKRLATCVPTTELFTLAGYPIVSNIVTSRNQQTRTTLSGRTYVAQSFQTFRVDLDFKDYPSSFTADLENAISLYDRETSFNVYLCGGRDGSTYFNTPLSGFRIQDLIEVRIVGDLQNTYSDNYYKGLANIKLRLEESL